jgi:hypothetical protein
MKHLAASAYRHTYSPSAANSRFFIVQLQRQPLQFGTTPQRATPLARQAQTGCDASVVVAPTDANDDKEHGWRDLSPQASSGVGVCTVE